jgi:hypothetical protein
VSHFIVERFVPGATAGDVRAWGVAIEASIEALDLGGEVSHLGSELMSRDETCLCFFEAAEIGSIHRVNDHAEVPKRKDGDFVKVASKDVLLDEFSSYRATSTDLTRSVAASRCASPAMRTTYQARRSRHSIADERETHDPKDRICSPSTLNPACRSTTRLDSCCTSRTRSRGEMDQDRKSIGELCSTGP